MSVSGPSSRPITSIAWASSGTTCPAHFSLIGTTEDGTAANFTKGFALKSGYYLCYSKIGTTEDGTAANFTKGFALKSGYYLCYSKDLSGGMVVSDVQVISEKETLPHGYCYIPEFMESKASVWKKKRVCVRIVPVESVTTAVLDIRLTAKSKMMLQQYTCLGDILGYVLWYMKGPFSTPGPQPKPRSINLDMRQLSLEAGAPPLPLRPSNQPLVPPKVSRRRGTLNTKDSKEPSESVCDGSSMGGITAMDGVPFALHPKFETQSNGQVSVVSLDDIRIKSIHDIENEYNYSFLVEESAAKRSRPLM